MERTLKRVTLKYTINMTAGTPQNGWDGIFSFYNTSTGGRVSMQTNPYLCYNSDGWIDINQPGDNADNKAPYMKPGTEYDVIVTITGDGVAMSVDGEELIQSVNGSTSDYSKILKAISGADKLTFGVGLAKSSYWNTELCTLTDILFSSVKDASVEEPSETEEPDDPTPEEPEDPIDYDEVFYKNDSVILSANNVKTVLDNPFQGKTIDKLYIAYTIEMTEESVKNGWDAILSFYDTASTGRISVQTAPYLCYNDWNGNWIDFNNPNLTGAVDKAPSFAPGTKHDVAITVTKDNCVMTVDGEVLDFPKDGSDTASCKTLLEFVTKCDQMTLGVGLADTAFWYTEVCNITNLVVSTGQTAQEEESSDPSQPENPDEPTGPEEPTEPTDPDEPTQPEEPEVTGYFYTKWGRMYYATNDGTDFSGFLTIDGYTYYIKENGAVVKQDYVDLDEERYYFDEDGHMVTGFMTKWTKTYYFGIDGKLIKDSLVTVDEATYYLNSNGTVVKSSFVEFEDGKRYFDTEGKMVQGKTITRWFKQYTFDENGILIG